MTNTSVLMGCTIVNLITSQIGVWQGYVVRGIAQAPQSEQLAESPGVWGIVEWTWDSLAFAFNMATFQIDSVPWLLSAVFVVVQLMIIWCIICLVRGNA